VALLVQGPSPVPVKVWIRLSGSTIGRTEAPREQVRQVLDPATAADRRRMEVSSARIGALRSVWYLTALPRHHYSYRKCESVSFL
jgi:hypothetical protein